MTRRIYIVCCNDALEEAYLYESEAVERVAELRETETNMAKFWHYHDVPLKGFQL